MASAYTQPMQALIDALSRLPGIGPKSAQRIAFHLIKSEDRDVENLSSSITKAKATVKFCQRCSKLSEADLCQFC
ncbi:MAG: recombination protein RecR, partial [Acidimicrobiaceae bacterium]